jgi:hypothetical protein
MTIPYNSVWFSCFIKFIEELRKDGIEYTDFNDDTKKKIKNMHKDFYDTLKNEVKREFYTNDNNIYLKKFNYIK